MTNHILSALFTCSLIFSSLCTAAQPLGSYVGELQENWQFPSDHLPIGMTFDNFHIVSWNVLDAEYMNWVIEENSQGLSRSLIANEHIYIGNSKLTLRDQHVVRLILEMISHPTHPRSILCLQECSKPFIKELHSQLPAHFKILSSRGEALLFNQNLFAIETTRSVSGIFADAFYRTVQDTILCRKDNEQRFRVINAHLPGDPRKPGRFEFAHYLAKTFNPDLTTIVMGDMNFNELEMAEALSTAFDHHSPFSISSPYCTNVSPFIFNSKAIDHFFIYSPESSPVVLSNPDEVVSELAQTAALL